MQPLHLCQSYTPPPPSCVPAASSTKLGGNLKAVLKFGKAVGARLLNTGHALQARTPALHFTTLATDAISGCPSECQRMQATCTITD